jgi:hypothetical protein
MTQCDHPASDEDRLVPSSRIGEYIVQIGSRLAQGPIPEDKIEEARRLCRGATGATARTLRWGNKDCPKCGGWWSEIWVCPSRPGDDVADDVASA